MSKAQLTAQSSLRPTRKVGFAAMSGAVVTLLTAAAGLLGVSVSADVAAALTTLISAGAAYLVRERSA